MNDTQITREIGGSGVSASAVGLGTWAIGGWMWGGTDEAQSIDAIHASLDAGITLIDTAPAYGLGRSEEIVGAALKGRREKAVIATKCGLVWHTHKGRHFFDEDGHAVHRYLGSDAIVHEVEQSLKRLQTDHIDLYITHWQDETTPIEETMRALEDLRQSGKIRAIGASNVSEADLTAYVACGGLDAIQERYSLLDRNLEPDILPVAQRNNISVLSYSSLSLGLLSGLIGPDRTFNGDDQRKDNPRFSTANRQKVGQFARAIAPVAEAHRATTAQIVIAWTIARPGITFALCGARTRAQALDNARAGSLRLSPGDIAAIDTAANGFLTGMDG